MSGNKVIVCRGATYNEYVAQQNIFGTVNVNLSGNGEKDSQTVSPVNLIGKTVAEQRAENDAANTADRMVSLPKVEFDKKFHPSLKIEEVKQALYRLISMEEQNGEVRIAHWFVVWKFFKRYKFTDASQAAFISWVKAVYGWKWKTENFKGSVVLDSLKKNPLDEWTEEKISGQDRQAEGYIRWRDTLIDAFLEKDNDNRMQCREEFRSAWFATY